MLKEKRTITTITNTVRRCDDKVPLTKTWESLNQRYGVGSVIGARLHLSEHDHRTLRNLLQQNMTFDPLTQTAKDLQDDRIGLGSKFRNEKVSGNSVEADMVLIGAGACGLILPSGSYTLPTCAALSIPARELHGLKRVVLIENLPVMYALNRYRWPDDLAGVPMLFRGSPQYNAKAVSLALEGVESVICFPDYDPQGLMNSLTQRRGIAVILPTNWTIGRIVSDKRDKPVDFENQQAAREWLSTRQFPPVKRMLEERLAISQESMAGESLEMYTLPDP